MSEPPVLELHGIVKWFGSVPALRGADFVLRPGEIHALLGENGAGKSTLLHIACGMVTADQGTLRVRGREAILHSPREARAWGIGMVHQHFTSIGALTIAENLQLATGSLRRWPEGGATQALLGGLEPSTRVETLGVAGRQRLEIVKALATGARILLLDEPSAALAPTEVDELLGMVKRFVRDGGAVALVTHKLPEVLSAADQVTVLRQGATVLRAPVATQSARGLAEAMLGEAGSREAAPSGASPVPKRSAGAAELPPVVRIANILIQRGELVGVAAVEGNGQRELLRQIAGVGAGLGSEVTVSAPGPIGFVPEDRIAEGLIPAMSVAENMVLGLDRDPRWSRGPSLDWPVARSYAARLIEKFDIRASGPAVPAGNLSGGNQQKLVLARALEAGARLLVAENPTRGLDIRATAELHERLRAAARAGVTVIVYSSDLDEVLKLAQRVLVVHAGQVHEAPASADRQLIGAMMLGLGPRGR